MVMEVDPESLKGALDLVGQAGSATSQIAKGLEAIKGLFQTAGAGDDAAVKLAISELSMQIATATMTNSDLKIKLAALQGELADLNRFQSDLERYELWETPLKSIVLRLKSEQNNGEPTHYLCPSCIEVKRKVILQGGNWYKDCNVCKGNYSFENEGPLNSSLSGSVFYG